jgi:hypothetical protein
MGRFIHLLNREGEADMKKRIRLDVFPTMVCFLAVAICFVMVTDAAAGGFSKWRHYRGRYMLSDSYEKTYAGGDDGGLAHITYWGIGPGNAYYDALDEKEQAKAGKINANVIHSSLFNPWQIGDPDIAGLEVTGLLKRWRREQSITFRLPDEWNGDLIVAGTPGLRNEYANEAIFVPWLLAQGYAYVQGNKGIPGGANDMIAGDHPTQYWGIMMIDLALWARQYLRTKTGQYPERTYAVGLSNGGYQTRRALEIDHKRVKRGWPRLFDGGLDWSGAYWPDARVLDQNGDRKVSLSEYAQANTLINSIDKGTLTMKWAYDPDSLNQPEEFYKSPPYPDAYFNMTRAGFTPQSGVFWGYYNTNFDAFQYVPGFEIFRGVGYYNLVSYVYRADLRGDDPVASAAYSCYSDPANPNTPPPIYDWLENAPYGGWTQKAVWYALRNANSGEFSAPMISLHGLADGLVAFEAQAVDYRKAIETYGNPEMHRLYGIANAGHVDTHADAVTSDFDFDGVYNNEGMADRLTPMQAYAQRAFDYLVDWVEAGVAPADSKVIPTDPVNDISDSLALDW